MRTYLIGASLLTLAACATTEPADPQRSATPAEATSDGEVAEPVRGEGGKVATTSAAVLAAYAPNPSRTSTINYELVDEALDLMVFNGGPSTRKRQRRPDALSGTRFVKGHDGAFRLEGNKIFFSQFDDETKAVISEYRQSLEDIGRRVDITALGKNEQLAYWYNLHNLVVIDEIAQRYPSKYPRKLKVGPNGETLHEARIIDLGGPSRLSLRDVREIVYTHWSDPRVLYGFFHGDIGGPQIRGEAYTGENVGERLDRQAREYVNSLRGVARGRNTLYVSEVYGEGRPHFFPVWPGQLKAHLLEYADEEVAEIIREKPKTAFGQYEERVADLAGGERGTDLGSRGAASTGGTVPPTVVRMAEEYRQKLEILRRDGKLKPRVIIIDLPSDDPDDGSGEVD